MAGMGFTHCILVWINDCKETYVVTENEQTETLERKVSTPRKLVKVE